MSAKDKYLLNSLMKGDKKGILELYTLIYPKIEAYILKNKGSQDNTKDIVQQGLMQLYLRANSNDFELKSSLVGYLYTTCRNLWVRQKKIERNKVTLPLDHTPLSINENIINATIEQEKWELFQEKLRELSENCRRILELYFSKINYSEIAKKLEYSSDNVVRQRVFKCKKKLKDLIHSDNRYKEIKD